MFKQYLLVTVVAQQDTVAKFISHGYDVLKLALKKNMAML